MGWKHMGPELENSTFLKGNWNAMSSKSEVEACDRREAGARAAVEPFFGELFFAGRDDGWSPEEKRQPSFCEDAR